MVRPRPVSSRHYVRDYVSGMGAAISTTLLTYPINKLIYRQILEGVSFQVALNSMKVEGSFLLYRGVLPPMTQKCLSLSTMLGCYSSVVMLLKNFHLNEHSEIFYASLVSGSLEALLMPLERIQVLLVDAQYNHMFKNTFHAFYRVGKKYGFKEYYRGFLVIWLRNTMSNSSFFLLKHEFQKQLSVSESSYMEGFKNFCCGGLLGVVMAVTFYPLKVIKIVCHKQLGTPFLSISQLSHIVYRKDGGGIKNFYRGVELNASRAVLSWGITNMIYEFIRQLNIFK